jgi:succinate dehydrogenase hydrophobic anchor subunit
MRDQALWTWHLIAGAVILVLLGMHMGIMHLNEIFAWFNRPETRAIDWVNVLARARMVGFAVSYVLLLAAALYHGLYGLRNILFELNPGSGAKTTISVIFVVGGLALFAFGTWAAIASYQNAVVSGQQARLASTVLGH